MLPGLVHGGARSDLAEWLNSLDTAKGEFQLASCLGATNAFPSHWPFMGQTRVLHLNIGRDRSASTLARVMGENAAAGLLEMGEAMLRTQYC